MTSLECARGRGPKSPSGTRMGQLESSPRLIYDQNCKAKDTSGKCNSHRHGHALKVVQRGTYIASIIPIPTIIMVTRTGTYTASNTVPPFHIFYSITITSTVAYYYVGSPQVHSSQKVSVSQLRSEAIVDYYYFHNHSSCQNPAW